MAYAYTGYFAQTPSVRADAGSRMIYIHAGSEAYIGLDEHEARAVMRGIADALCKIDPQPVVAERPEVTA